MGKRQEAMHKFGLIGKNISYSFSQNYFTEKFKVLGLHNYSYSNFDIATIDQLPTIITKDIKGLNVTIPYKEQVIDYLDEIDEEAKKIGAVNTIKITKYNKLKGFNTDVYGFDKSLQTKLEKHHKRALILGTGGASKAIAFVLRKLNIDYFMVSRSPKEGQLSYSEITKDIVSSHSILINCTPLGTYPNVDNCPDIPYKYLTGKHLLYDLIYNPSKTKFLELGEKKGVVIINGSRMLELQAEKSWEIWNM